MRPLKGKWRVFLIDQMDRANLQAADSLLKTLEEPPSHMILFVTAENPYDLPSTIRSRSVIFYLTPVAEEEMKVQVDEQGALTRITKLMDPASAYGEYIGATLIEPAASPRLADALQATFERDPDLYYEDGYQEMVDRGHPIGVTSIPSGTQWVEVDDHADLARAREIACRY